MNISSILDLNRLGLILDQTPKFPLNVIFCGLFLSITNWIKGHLLCEIVILEVICLLLEISQRIDRPVLEAIISSAN